MEEQRMPPAALIFVACQAFADQGRLDVSGFPVDGIKLDHATCRNELVQIYDETEGPALAQGPVKCPHPDGTFPRDLGV
jgi:hypothetical protein